MRARNAKKNSLMASKRDLGNASVVGQSIMCVTVSLLAEIMETCHSWFGEGVLSGVQSPIYSVCGRPRDALQCRCRYGLSGDDDAS